MSAQSPEGELLYLSRRDVEAACAAFDVVEVVRTALLAYQRRDAVLPDEAYLSWSTPAGGSARSLNMPGWLHLESDVAGTKIINANIDNPRLRAMPRAGGLVLLFDAETAAPTALCDAALISSLRTAAVTALGLEVLHPGVRSVLAIVGCGAQAAAHLDLLARRGVQFDEVRLHDAQPENARRLGAAIDAGETTAPGARARAVSSAEAAVRGADVVVTTTTTTSGYIPMAWLGPGTFVSHVSLDDLLPEVLVGCDKLYVDSIALVAADHRRVLGRLMRDGVVAPTAESAPPAQRAIDGELGGVLLGETPAPGDDDLVVLNPFGMSLEDIAVASTVVEVARDAGIGVRLPR